MPVDKAARTAIQRRLFARQQRQQPHHGTRPRIDARVGGRLANEMRDTRVVDAEQHQRPAIGRVERLPQESAALARHEVDAVEHKTARPRIGHCRSESRLVGTQLIGAVEPRPGESERKRHQRVTSLKKVSPNLPWNDTASGGMICV